MPTPRLVPLPAPARSTTPAARDRRYPGRPTTDVAPRRRCRCSRFPPAKIRNVALVGHGGAGQDDAGRGAAALRRRDQPAWAGSRTARPSSTTTPRSRRGASRSSLALAPFEWKGHKINLIDTPGYADFVGDVARRAAGRRPRRVRGERGRGRRGADRGGLAAGRRARRPPHDLRQQARPRAGRLRAHPRPAARPLRRRRRAARAADRRGGRLPRRRRPAHRHRLLYDGGTGTHGEVPDDMEDARAPGPRQPGRGHRRGRRRPARALPRRRRARRSRSSSTRSPTASTRPRCSRSCAARPPTEVAIDRLADFICEIGPSPARPPAGRRSRPGDTTVEVAPDPDGPAARLRVQDHRRPVRRPHLAVQGAVGHDPARRPPRQHPHRHRRAAARPVHAAGQGAGAGDRACAAGDIAAVAKLSRHAHRRHARPEGHAGDGRPRSTPPEPVLAVAITAQHPGRRGQARRRAAPPARGGPGARSSSRDDETHQTLLRGVGETHVGHRPRAARAQVRRRRSTPRTCAVALPRDDHRPRRGRGQAQEADRRPRPVRRVRASASSRCRGATGFEFVDKIVGGAIPKATSPRCRRASRRPWRRGGVLRLPGGRRARSSCSTASTTRSTRRR